MFRSELLMKKSAALFILILTVNYLSSQVGGSYTYAFLDMPATATITSMGGNLITFKDDDPGQASDNPSLLNYKMDKTVVLSYMNYFAGINNGFASYTFHKDIGTFNAAMKYIDYGSFREADAGNNEIGTFSANEMALIAGYGRPIDSSFSVGANLKLIYSNLYLYNSFGVALDLSASYEIKDALFLATFVVKNIGIELKSYVPGDPQSLPFDVQFGVSKSFEKMPFKFSFVVHQLGRGRLTYPPSETQSTSSFGDGDEADSQSNFENIIRHCIIATEFLPGRNFNIRLGYNFQRRKEMLYADVPGTVGLSWGFGLKIAKFHFSYARSAYHLSGSPNHFSVLTRFSDWSKS